MVPRVLNTASRRPLLLGKQPNSLLEKSRLQSRVPRRPWIRCASGLQPFASKGYPTGRILLQRSEMLQRKLPACDRRDPIYCDNSSFPAPPELLPQQESRSGYLNRSGAVYSQPSLKTPAPSLCQTERIRSGNTLPSAPSILGVRAQ